MSVDLAPFIALGAALPGRDLPAYEAANLDPTEPVLGLGSPDRRLCILGRDPGRNELIHRQPFVGAGGRVLRDALHRVRFGAPCPSPEASLAVGGLVYWLNTVPYKPVGNKVWPARVRRDFRPLIARLLLSDWRGSDVLCFGNEALHWFGLGDAATRDALRAHAERSDRYEQPISVVLREGSLQKDLTLHFLPHPSPLNAAWSGKVGPMTEQTLRRLGCDEDPASWSLPAL